MRIALSGWFWQRPETGSGQYVRRLLAALSRLQPESEFWVLLPTTLPSEEAPAARNVASILVHAPPTALGKVWWEQVAVPRAARRLGVDVLHVPYWAPPLWPGAPTVVTVHDLIPLLLPDYRGGAAVRLYTSLVRAATPHATLLLTDSEASRQDILHHLRVPAERVQAVHLAADDVYTPTPEPGDNRVLGEFGLDPGYVLYLGGFDVRKNLRGLFDAFAWVHKALDQARLVVAGKLPARDTDFAPDPRRLAWEAGLPDGRVRFIGSPPEASKPALYRGARAFVFPSRYEGFGLPPLEALSCGVPVVGSCATSLPEVVGNAGVLTDPADAAGMSGALIQILNDDGFYHELRQCAICQARKFSWTVTAQKTFAAYRQAVERRTA